MAFDPDEYLKEKSSDKSIIGFDPDEYLADREQQTGATDLAQKGVQSALPAVTGATTPTGLAKLGSDIAEVAKPIASATATPISQMYRAHPILSGAADIAGLATTGVPFASTGRGLLSGAEGLYSKYQAAKEGLTAASKIGSEFTNVADIGKYHGVKETLDKLSPGVADKIKDIYHNSGGGAGVKNWLTTTAEGQALLANPQTTRVVEEYMKALPSFSEKVGKVAGPVLRGAGRVLGPVGLGMNMYDAGQYAQESQLGSRLAEGQGNMAQQAYRQLPAQINTPGNPQPGTPQFQQMQQQYSPQQPPVGGPAAEQGSTFIQRMSQKFGTYTPIRKNLYQ
tara:strand:- start:1882 stop:2895 length:1014 start_codon:yes stop_codon:yes gene_type:complete